MKKGLLSLVFLWISLYAVGQLVSVKIDSVSVEEMRANFYQSDAFLVLNDSMHRYDKKPVSSGQRSLTLFIEKEGQLHQLKQGKALPASFYRICGNPADREYYLSWVGVCDENAVDKDSTVRQFLKDTYGTFKYKEKVELVPAKWFSGALISMSNPFRYGGMILSENASIISFSEGCLSDNRFVPLGSSRLWLDVEEVRNAYTFGRQQGGVSDYRCSGLSPEEFWKEERRNINACLALFARDVMRLCREEREAPKSEFSLLFHYDSQRRLHVDVLLPKELNEEERRRMDELQRAVALQPPGLFSSFFTIDGRVFPGMYVKATYERGRWRFEDYRFLNLKG